MGKFFIGCLAGVLPLLIATAVAGLAFASCSMAYTANQKTKQVEIQQAAETTRNDRAWSAQERMNEVNSATAIRIEEIKADATKKTSWAFVAWWGERYLAWGIPILAVLTPIAFLLWSRVKYEEDFA